MQQHFWRTCVRLRRSGVSALLSALLAAASWAQSAASRGSIGGTVTDPQGKDIPGAHVTLRNLDFTSTRDLVTDEQGAFRATMLTIGNYTIEVKAQGFTLKKPARIALNVGASVDVDIHMGVAAVS